MIPWVTTDPQADQDQATTTRTFWLAERARSSPCYPALSHPVFRRVLPGAAASALGDGMSAVAIAWLALKLAPVERSPGFSCPSCCLGSLRTMRGTSRPVHRSPRGFVQQFPSP
jgi:hypothetical protein